MKAKPEKNRQILTTTCSFDCGSRCLLTVHVRNNRIEHISSENRSKLHLKACLRGLAQKSVVYHSDRLRFPLKRIGKRGTGIFEPISWDEALETISDKIQNTISKFGTGSLYFVTNTGSMATLHNTPHVTQRFFSLLGKCTTTWGDPSLEGAHQSALATFGTTVTGSSRDNLLSSKLIVLWGWNPLVSRFGPDTVPYLKQAQAAGTRIVCVDPRKSQTCAALADQWISLKPGTDTAFLIAMVHVMIAENLLDQSYVDRYTHGFGQFHAYVTGETDGVIKDPAWAQGICGTPADTIVNLARAYIDDKPAALIAGWAPGRTAFGEQFHRAVSTLAAISGNIGIAGGHAAGGPDYIDLGFIEETLPSPDISHHTVHFTELYDSILDPKSRGNQQDCQLLYIVGCNLLNQNLNLNKGIRALQKVDFLVTHELFLTPTAKFADVVLPVQHFMETEDIGQPFVGGPYCIHMQKILNPPPDTKTDLEIFSMLAERLGIEHDEKRSDAQWLETFLESEPGFPNLETLRTTGIHKFEVKNPHVAFREQIENPGKNKFPTPSGKIEIFSHRFAEMKNANIPPLPTYIPSPEGPEDTQVEVYPIQLISPHSRARANSQFDNVKRIKKQADDTLWMNPIDAQQRNIQDRESAYVYNQRGCIRVTVNVTPRIMKGCASIDQGQWYAPDDHGIDTGGCANVLTTDRKSPAGAFPCNTCLVQIEKCLD